MKVYILLLLFLVFVKSENKKIELKIDYYEKLIEEAFEQVKTYKSRQDNSDYFKNISVEAESKDFGAFDFVVIGAGSSGSVVASRLTEVEKYNVLLLEAGDWDDDLTDIPYISEILQFSDRNWGYTSTPQKNGCLASKGRQCVCARGKVVGGTGTINTLDYVRGNKGDYDNWASLGNPEWSFGKLLPYFKKMENFESDNADHNYRGFGGPVNVAYKTLEENFSNISNAYSKIGIKTIDDYNAKQQVGVSRIQRFIKFGKRVSGATVYIRPSSSRHNFNITVNAFVTKILIDESSKTAYGVEFVKNGEKFRAIASKEVILSAGTINTPQILMLSGIGPANDLQKLKIPVLAILPVGKFVRDQYTFSLSFKVNYTIPTKPFREYIRDYLNGIGILTNFQNLITTSLINTRNSSSSDPNVEIVISYPTPVCKAVPSLFNYKEEINEYTKRLDSHKDLTITIFILQPKSLSSIRLKSEDPIDFPLIDFRIFNDSDDIEVLYEAILIAKKIVAELKGSKEIEFRLCSKHIKFESREYYFCMLRYLTLGGYHISSSAKMGHRNDPSAVVDQNLRVYGVKNLRVVDCSIMPTPISGHPNAAALMIGEKAADLIKSDHPV